MTAATARARERSVPALSREEALEILNSMPYLVATSNTKLLPEQFTVRTLKYLTAHNQLHRIQKPPIIPVAFTVVGADKRSYTFESQPFMVMREITREEFRRVAPWACTGRFHYIISTD
jgi:hypothetical protein